MPITNGEENPLFGPDPQLFLDLSDSLRDVLVLNCELDATGELGETRPHSHPSILLQEQFCALCQFFQIIRILPPPPQIVLQVPIKRPRHQFVQLLARLGLHCVVFGSYHLLLARVDAFQLHVYALHVFDFHPLYFEILKVPPDLPMIKRVSHVLFVHPC